MSFKHLDKPLQWKNYFTKYPHGFTIFEALTDWINHVNFLNDKVENWDTYIDDFLSSFDSNLHSEVRNMITELQETGQLGVLIEQVLRTGLSKKVDKVLGKGLSTNDFTDIMKQYTLQVPNKAEKAYVDSKINAISTGNPKGVYNTVAQLRAAIPNGNTNIYVVNSTGYWYFWDGSDWQSGGEYIANVGGNVYRQGLLSPDDHLDDIVESGYYYFTITNKPQGTPFDLPGMLVVFQGLPNNLTGVVQLLFSPTGAYYRYRITAGWRPWYSLVSGTASGDATILTPLILPGYVELKENDRIVSTSWELLKSLYDPRTDRTYPAGTIMHGYPYRAQFGTGRDICHYMLPVTFFSMANYLYSDVYETGELRHGATCSTFASAMIGSGMYLNSWEIIDFDLGFMDKVNYTGPESILPGDIYGYQGHSELITDILTNTNGDIVAFGITDMWHPHLRHRHISVSDFESALVQNGGKRTLTRNRNLIDDMPTYDRIDYPMDVQLNKGHKSLYKLDDDVVAYVPESLVLYYRHEDDLAYSPVDMAILPEVRNIPGLVNISEYLDKVGKWFITTDPNTTLPAELIRYETGQVTVTDNLDERYFSTSGHSSNITPLWFDTIILTSDPDPTNGWQIENVPPGYSATFHWFNKDYITDTTRTDFGFTKPFDGYIVRVYYKTEFGQVFTDSEPIF